MTISQQRILSLAMDYGSGEKKQELDQLKKELAATELCNDKATAAAFGYLLAKREEDYGGKTETSIDEQVRAVLYEEVDVTEATSLIFGLIYLWLRKEISEDGYAPDDYLHELLNSLFVPFVKEGTIKKFS